MGVSDMTITVPEDLDSEIDVLLDDLPDVGGTLREMRARKPAQWGMAFGSPALLLLDHALVNAAFKDEAALPSAEFYTRTVTEVLGRNIQCMQGEEHRLNRALVSPSFRQRLMPDLIGPLLEPVANDLIDRVIDDGHADLVADFTSRYPFIVITRLLGLPSQDEAEIKHLAIAMLDIQRANGEALAASRRFVEIVQPVLDRRRVDPTDDLISTLAVTEVEGVRLSDEEIFSFLRLLFPAGADTTYLGLGNTLHALLTTPGSLDWVLADPDTRCRLAAEEGIRLNPPVSWIVRIAPEDMVWNGMAIPKDAQILLGITAANRDPAVVVDPDTFDPSREPVNVMTFGFGTHFCLGAALARAELDTALRVILTRLPNLRLAEPEGVRITGTIHHLLRGPNRLPVTFG